MIDFDPLAALPVCVRGVEEQSGILTLFGDDWGLAIACDWEGTVGGRALSWDDDDMEDRVWDLIGEDLVAVVDEGTVVRFEFSEATLIATPNDYWDPWVLDVRGHLLVGRSV